MCNVYEPASEAYLRATWKTHEYAVAPFKQRIGPRDNGPFVTSDKIIVGQWGMIRPGSPERVAKDARGRPLMTNNARVERMTTAPTYRDAWKQGQRCLIPAVSFDEPYWGTGKNIWWRFARADGEPWALAGLWSVWTDRATGEIVPSFTMITQNCDAHPLLKLMHKPDTTLSPEKQDKRAVVPLERIDWDAWLNGSTEGALSLIRLPLLERFKHGAADPSKHVTLGVGPLP
jgi:putative SOS response-associated peptidase YedK